jgi:hypothetical protein
MSREITQYIIDAKEELGLSENYDDDIYCPTHFRGWKDWDSMATRRTIRGLNLKGVEDKGLA